MPANNVLSRRIMLGFLVTILLVGIYARWSDLAWHFTNNDDLRGIRFILEGSKHMPRIFAIPDRATNAPFQFIFSSFLLSPQMDYRELLFWGRLPSCVMGILALFAMVYFYRRWESPGKNGVFLGLALLACSWENIAYAKQTYSYAIGVLALMLMLGFFAENTDRGKLSLGRWLTLSLGLALVSNMQYEIHIFIPPFFLVLFLHQWSLHDKKKTLIVHCFLGMFLYAALMFPTWYFFLWNKLGRGVPRWENGPDPVHVLVLQKADSVWKNLLTASRFYAGNLYTVFQSKIGFFPEDHVAFPAVSTLFYGFFLLGIVRCFLDRDRRRKLFGIFFIFSLGIWWALTAVHKISFSATRHTLILLPFFCVMVTEGVSLLTETLFPEEGPRFLLWIKKFFPAGLALIVLVIFGIYFGQFTRERRDLMDEKKLLPLLRTYDPEMLVYNNETFGFKEMKGMNAFIQSVLDRQSPSTSFSTIAFLSRYNLESMTWNQCEEIRAFFNAETAKSAKSTGKPQAYLRYPCRDYKIIYSEKMPSEVQTDFTKKNSMEMYTNSLYVYVFRRK